MKAKTLLTTLGMILGLATAWEPASAFTIIPQPDTQYLTETTLIPITGSEFSTVTSITDGTETVTFSSPMEIRQVPGSWGTWGSPPDTESSTPTVLYSNGETSITMDLSLPAYIFGFEAEPNPFEVLPMTASFFDGATLLGTISLDVNGDAGARLFAASVDPITRVVFSSPDADFSVAQLRYSLTKVPEPGTLLLLGIGLAGLGRFSRRRIG